MGTARQVAESTENPIDQATSPIKHDEYAEELEAQDVTHELQDFNKADLSGPNTKNVSFLNSGGDKMLSDFKTTKMPADLEIQS